MRLVIIIVGIVVLCLMGFGLRGFFANPDVHLGLRIGVGAVGGGVLWLVVRTIRARIAENKTGDSEEVEQ